MKIGAVPLENLKIKYSYDSALLLEIGADKKRNFKTKYPEIIPFIFEKLDIKTMITLELDPERDPVILADGRKLPFKNSSFNILILMSVLEHCYANFEDIIKESSRVLSHKGIIIGFVPFFLRYHGNDYWRFTYEGIERLTTDFENVRIIPIGGPFSVSIQIIADLIKPALLRNIFAYVISPVSTYIDRVLWRVYKRNGKMASFVTRGYFFIGEK